jgi:hypothetical protein
MNHKSNEPLDLAIKEAARQLVSRDAPDRLRAAVLTEIDPNRSRPHVVRSGCRIGLATSVAIALVVVVLWKTESPVQRTPNTTSQTPPVSQQAGTDVPRRSVETAVSSSSTDVSTYTASRRRPLPFISVPVELSTTDTFTPLVNLIKINDIEPSAIALSSVDIKPPIELASLNVNPIDPQP